MAQRKPFLLRLPPELMDELNRWAKDELRSVNAQIEYALREALRQRHRHVHDEPTRRGETIPDARPSAGASES